MACIPIWPQHMQPAAAWVVAAVAVACPLQIEGEMWRSPVPPKSQRPHDVNVLAALLHMRKAKSKEHSNGAAPQNAFSSSGNTLTIHFTFQTKMAAQLIASHHEILRHLLLQYSTSFNNSSKLKQENGEFYQIPVRLRNQTHVDFFSGARSKPQQQVIVARPALPVGEEDQQYILRSTAWGGSWDLDSKQRFTKKNQESKYPSQLYVVS